MKKSLQLVLSLGCLLLGSTIAYAAIPSPIRFAMEATYPPFEYIEPTGEIRGFDVDLAKALCKEIKVECVFSNQPWDSLIPSLKLGKFDALISAMAITDARKKQVDFTNSYLQASASFVGLANKSLSLTPEGLAGKTIGVQGGTVFEPYLKDTYKNKIKVKIYANAQDAFLDLNAKRIDLFLGDTPIILDWLNKRDVNHQYSIIGEPLTDTKSFGEGYAIAIRKGNPEFLQALNKALETIKHNGVYESIVTAHRMQSE